MAEDVVQVTMVESLVDVALERREVVIVTDEAIIIQAFRSQFDDDDVVVTVEPSTLMVGRQVIQLMGGGEMKLLGDAVHQRTSVAEYRDTAAFQKSRSSYSVGSGTPARWNASRRSTQVPQRPQWSSPPL